MSTETAPASSHSAKAPAKPSTLPADKPLDLKDLTTSKEGVVVVKPKVDQKSTPIIVSVRPVLGYGGPIAFEDQKGRGLQKALAGDSIYTLDDGRQYVLAAELGEALGLTQPAADVAEQEAIERQGNFGLTLKEAAEARKAAEEADKKAKASATKETAAKE